MTTKHDAGKPRWSLVPWAAMKLVVEVLTLGAQKYGDGNWATVPNARGRYHDAALRHLTEWAEGNALDSEWSKPHLAHAICSLLFILALDLLDESKVQP